MGYKFHYNMKAYELFRLSMYNVYHTMTGAANILFTAALMVLTVKFFPITNPAIAGLLLLGCFWFPVFHPVIIYSQARKQAAAIPKDMRLSFDGSGIHVETPKEISHISWTQVRNIIEIPGMTIIRSGGRYGFMLPDRMLGDQKQDFLNYINKMVRGPERV